MISLLRKHKSDFWRIPSMKCLNCGFECKNYLCENCISEKSIADIFENLRFYNPEKCNDYLKEYIETFESPYMARECIQDILKLFDSSISDYYYCRYYKLVHDSQFEETAVKYLNTYKAPDIKWQTVLYELLDNYARNDFIKPQKWCEYIKHTDGLCCELYYSSAEFFAMVGDYDISDEIIRKALKYCNDDTYNSFLFHSRESEIESLNKLSKSILGYRTKKPYWPQKEERRRALAVIYDKKGISYPRIEKKPDKVSESDFIPLTESPEKPESDYCAFWCAEVFSTTAAKDIYQIGAVKVRNGVVSDEFQKYIRPQKSTATAKKSVAKEAGIDIEVLNSAEDVDQVMGKFFSFVGNDILISTDALRSQEGLITRAARYSGMKSIPNLFFDLLDFAAEISPEFDMQNNTRDYLLSHFGIKEGVDALGKATANIQIYDCLKEMDKR